MTEKEMIEKLKQEVARLKTVNKALKDYLLYVGEYLIKHPK